MHPAGFRSIQFCPKTVGCGAPQKEFQKDLVLCCARVGPFCRNGRSAKPNRARTSRRTKHQHACGSRQVRELFAAIQVAQVAAGRDVLPGRQDVQSCCPAGIGRLEPFGWRHFDLPAKWGSVYDPAGVSDESCGFVGFRRIAHDLISHRSSLRSSHLFLRLLRTPITDLS